jgi:putative colanic acid biosynthesis acetyltransferase WcaF
MNISTDGVSSFLSIDSPVHKRMHSPSVSSEEYLAVGSWSLSRQLLRAPNGTRRSPGTLNDASASTSDLRQRIDLRQSKSHWSLRTKLRRGLWNAVWHVLFRPTPKRLCNPWRVWLLILFGADVDGDVLVLGSCKILQPWKLRLGDGAALGAESEIYNYAPVSIGAMTVISQYSYLCTGTHDYTHPHMPLTWAPIHIGPECWIAADVFIAPGVSIGRGTVVGARSVVTHDLPEWSVCAGNPCKVLKTRVVSSLPK